MPRYDFAQPHDVARYLASVPSSATKSHGEFLRRNVLRGESQEFFDQVNAEYARLKHEKRDATTK